MDIKPHLKLNMCLALLFSTFFIMPIAYAKYWQDKSSTVTVFNKCEKINRPQYNDFIFRAERKLGYAPQNEDIEIVQKVVPIKSGDSKNLTIPVNCSYVEWECYVAYKINRRYKEARFQIKKPSGNTVTFKTRRFRDQRRRGAKSCLAP